MEINMTLYEIDSAITSCVDPETGEILDLEWLNKLQMDRSRKIENILLWIKNLESDAEQIKAEEKALADRRKAAEKKAESLRGYVSDVLHGEKFSSPKVAVTWRKSEAVIVDDVEMMEELSDDYLIYDDPKPDKTKIKAALKDGAIIPGCHLEKRNNMVIQ